MDRKNNSGKQSVMVLRVVVIRKRGIEIGGP